jgi:hypothetical protein
MFKRRFSPLYSFDHKTSEFKAVAIDLVEAQGDAIDRGKVFYVT